MAFEVTTADTVGQALRNNLSVCWALEEGFALSSWLCQTRPAGGHSQSPVSCLFPSSYSLGAQLQIECNVLRMWTLNPHRDRNILTALCLW